MCFGYDGDTALRESLERKGASRRTLLSGAVAGTAGVAALAAAAPARASGAAPGRGRGHGHGHGRTKEVPTDLISIQLYTLRSAMTTGDSIKQQLDQLAHFGYERVERAGLYPAATGLDTAAKLKAEFDARGIWASSSHDGISADAAALQQEARRRQHLPAEVHRGALPQLRHSKSEWQLWAEQMNTEAAAARSAVCATATTTTPTSSRSTSGAA